MKKKSPMSDDQLCYICFEPTTQRCHCECVNRYAHVSCLLKFHSQRQCTRCMICTKQIKNLKLHKKTRTRPSANSIVLVGGGVIFVGTMTIALLLCRLAPFSTISFALSLVFFTCSATGLVFFTRGLFYWRVQKRPLFTRQETTRVTAVAGPVAPVGPVGPVAPASPVESRS